MEKVNFKKNLKQLYQPSAKEAGHVAVPKMIYLMLDGEGNPNTSEAYQTGVEVLFALSYSIKFMVKKGALAIDYGVMPLEGLWWTDDMSKFSIDDKANWKWTMMIMQPDFVTHAMLDEAVAELRRKKNPAALGAVRSFTPILEIHKGVDRRSIVKSNEVVAMVLKKPRLFDTLYSGLFTDDSVIRMRSTDAAEKVTSVHLEYLALQYKHSLLKSLAKVEQV